MVTTRKMRRDRDIRSEIGNLDSAPGLGERHRMALRFMVVNG
jgi:hypothetical protein